jgi:hypothetical protein
MVKSRLSRRIFAPYRLRPGRSEENLFNFIQQEEREKQVKAMKKEAKGFRLIFGYLGIFLMFEGLVTILPFFWLFIRANGLWPLDFVIPAGLVGIVLGAAFFFGLIAGRGRKAHFARNDDALAFGFALAFAVVLGSLPFYFTEIQLYSILGIAMSLWE